MGIEIALVPPDEMSLGLFMFYGEDEIGSAIHVTTLGLLFLEVNFVTHLKR